MSEISVSILRRLLPAYLRERPEIGLPVQLFLGAADGDGQPNAEDATLTSEEAARAADRLQAIGRTARTGLDFIRANRDALVGSLSSAQERMRRASIPETVQQLVSQAAAMQTNASGSDTNNHLSLEEIDWVLGQLQSITNNFSGVQASGLMPSVQTLVNDARELERHNPEAFFPETEEARRAEISLDFLKHLETGDWLQIRTLLSRMQAGDDPSVGNNPQAQFYLLIVRLMSIAGIDPLQTGNSWRLSYESVQRALPSLNQGVPASEAASPDEAMAELRYLAEVLRQQVDRLLGERVLAHPERTDLGVSLRAHHQRRPELFRNDPRFQLFWQEAGEDGVLTQPELARSLRLSFPGDGDAGAPPDPERVMGELRLLLTANPLPVEPAVASVRLGDSFIRQLNALVLEDLERMSSGFSDRDMELVETLEVWDMIPRLVTNFVTVGGELSDGYTYVEARQEQARVASATREHALSVLRRLIANPSLPSGIRGVPSFREWLSRRNGTQAQESIPNALSYLQQTQAEVAAMLDGPFFQATRLWNIRSERNPDVQARAWLSLANDLRNGAYGLGTTSVLHSVPNLNFARAILYSLRRQSENPDIQYEASQAFADSMGEVLLDRDGRQTQRGGGYLGLIPWDWFRNFPDEGVATLPSDAIFLAASIYGGGNVMRGLRWVRSPVGRRSMVASLQETFGIRGTAAAVGDLAGVSTVSEGSFLPWVRNMVQRQVVGAEANLDTVFRQAVALPEFRGKTLQEVTQLALSNLEGYEGEALRCMTRVREAITGLQRARGVLRTITAPVQTLAEVGEWGRGVSQGLTDISNRAARYRNAWNFTRDRVLYGWLFSNPIYWPYQALQPHRIAHFTDRELDVLQTGTTASSPQGRQSSGSRPNAPARNQRR